MGDQALFINLHMEVLYSTLLFFTPSPPACVDIQLALKVGDVSKRPLCLDEMQREVEVYGALPHLQGVSIPRLLLHGPFEGFMYCIGLSLCGSSVADPRLLSLLQKTALMVALDAVHAAGYLHNDIRRENLLVDEEDRVFLIDFGLAIGNSDVGDQQEESEMLREFLGLN